MTASAQREKLDPAVSAAVASSPQRIGLTWAWTLLGLGGSALLTLAGSRLGGGSVTWWFDPRLASDRGGQRLLFYLGVGLLIVAWLGLGTVARSPRLSPGRVALISGLWCLPLAVGVPLFSRDVYSYLAQGTIAHLGLSPYHYAPAVLGRLGQAHVLSAVDPFWRHTTAPYGPLFLGVISLIVGATGSHLVAGAVLIRAFDLVGLVLLAIFVPRLARRGGADPTRAVWLAVASPLVLLQLVAPAHNDLLMAGLMVAGVSVALEGRALLGIALCALAATVKLPAIVAVAFVALVWIREEATWRRRGIRVAGAAGVTLGTLGLVTVITGFGLGWVSSGLFSTPARVKLAVTPATDISWTLAKLLGDLGASVSFHSLHTAFRTLMFAASALVSLVLLFRARRATLVPYLGLSLVGLAIAGPALWPWYLSWGLVLLAAWKPAQRSWLTVLAIVVGAVLVQPGGILAIPLGGSPVVACVWLGLGLLLLHHWRKRQRWNSASGGPGALRRPRSVLAER